jgi:hypothetical protein
MIFAKRGRLLLLEVCIDVDVVVDVDIDWQMSNVRVHGGNSDLRQRSETEKARPGKKDWEENKKLQESEFEEWPAICLDLDLDPLGVNVALSSMLLPPM